MASRCWVRNKKHVRKRAKEGAGGTFMPREGGQMGAHGASPHGERRGGGGPVPRHTEERKRGGPVGEACS
jgi:hypothetical protein